MALRIFNYGYLNTAKNRIENGGVIRLTFPRCIVIYLEPGKNTPKEVSLELEFPDKTVHTFTVPAIRFLDYSIAEIEEYNLTLLLPFYVLKLRQKVKSAETNEKLIELSPLVAELVEEIHKAIVRSEETGMMRDSDARAVIEMMGKLYNTIYGEYPYFKETNTMVNDMMLTYSEEAELRGERRRSMEIAQELMGKGWSSKEIAETVKLDIAAVESLYTRQAQSAMQP